MGLKKYLTNIGYCEACRCQKCKALRLVDDYVCVANASAPDLEEVIAKPREIIGRLDEFEELWEEYLNDAHETLVELKKKMAIFDLAISTRLRQQISGEE